MNKKRLTVIIILIVLAAALIWITWFKGNIAVEAEAVSTGSITKYIEETGTIESKDTAVVGSINGGTISEVLFEEGDTVKIGDVIIKIDNNTEQTAALEIKSMESELAGIKVQYNLAKSALQKNKVLYDQGVISNDEYNQAVTNEKQLASQIASVSYAIASYKKSAENLTNKIQANIEGVITDIYVNKGEIVLPGASLVEISGPTGFYVKTNLIVEEADLINVGNKALIEKEDTGILIADSEVINIQPKAREIVSDLGINQKRVIVELSLNLNDTIRLGSNVDVKIIIEKKNDVLIVSDKAIFEKDKKQWVYIVVNDKAELRQIETGLEGEEYVEILSGLKEGELVILSPGDDIEKGINVEIN